MKTVMFFRSEINRDLIADTDFRIDIIEEVGVAGLNSIEGIDFFQEWKNLKDHITNLWQADQLPGFTIDMSAIDALAFYFDFVAQFFLCNGNEEDNQYLKLIDEFFKQYNLRRGEAESVELFNRAFKNAD
jgi:hypothetical protein